MAIQNVNGRNVYVLSPKAPTGKTTSGRNWATLYSDLRWQVWEAQQKNEENKIKLDLMSFEAQKEYYDQQKKFLQNRIADLQDIKLKSGQAGAGAAVSQALRAAEAIAPKSLGGRGASGPKFTRKVVTGRTDVGGEPIEGELVTETITGTLQTPPVGLTSAGQKIALKEGAGAQAGTVIQPSEQSKALRDALEKRALAALEAEGQAGGALGGDIDAEIKKLEAQLSGLAAPQFQTDADLLNRTQRAFEQNVGVIGQGGGPFGLAPRSRRLAPRVDQPTATAATEELLAARGIESERRSQLEDARKALLLRREDLMAAAEVDSEDFIADIDKQLADINTELAKPTVAQSLMADESFIPRRAGEFLLRGPTGGRDEQPVVAVESTPSAAPPTPETVKRQPPQFVLPSPDAAGFPLDTSRRAEMEALGVTPEQPPVAPVALPPEPVVPPSAPSEMQPEPTAGTVEPTAPFGKEEAIQNPEIIDNPQAEPARDLVKEAREYYRGMKVSKPNDPSELKRVNPVRYFGGEKEMVKAYILDLKREEVPVGEGLPTEPQSKKTSKQRKDLYSFNVSSEGILLAQKPKKLERLAKTSLPDDKRPQHIVIVDKLYETNANKANAFRLTYDEVSRVFANDPKKRTEAHKYLVAKDVLEGNKREPLA